MNMHIHFFELESNRRKYLKSTSGFYTHMHKQAHTPATHTHEIKKIKGREKEGKVARTNDLLFLLIFSLLNIIPGIIFLYLCHLL